MIEFRDYSGWIRRSPEGDIKAPELDLTTLFNEKVVLTGDLAPRNIRRGQRHRRHS